ncbi:MAG: DEAD/DEAH box helicase, partial [Treponema sp.]|nr:DEAD/DEAH box helicase [Treponema sp.]
QEEAWPLIAAGENVLAIAPTGSGKTLTAFLAAISRFIDGTYDAATLAVLYVSPLKALNEDIRRNILEPLRSLKDHFARAGEAFPGIRVETRSGDTPESQRRRFLASPPSVLAVTPESLAILLLNPRGRETLSKVKYLIIDEIHSVLAGKRGAFLSCQIDRLSLAAGEFQRTALSATVRPEKAAAEFAGGLGRPVRIVSPPTEKKIELLVDFPPDPPDPPAPAGKNGAEPFHYGKRYAALAETVLERLGFDGERCRRTVLVFTDSRQRAERIALLINKRAQELAAQRPAPPEQIAFAHHGSLSREVRHAVEQRLAEGRLSCVAATGSLELGIDIGSVDEVILAGSPGSTAAALQRIGRSGHGVGRVSRGLLVPFHRMDLVTAAALCGAVEDREIEEAYPVENPLDILSQVILELCAEKNQDETWQADELYETLRGFYIFRTLPRASFDTVILMLSGYYGGNRIRELKGRIYFDRTDGEIRAADGLLRILYTSGGVIANRGYFSLRLEDGTKIGELDEEFVWERRIGDSFEFGSRPWTISAIGSEAVTVVPAERQSEFAPFYHAGAVFRSPVLSRRILELFSVFNNRNTVDFPSFSRAAAEELSAFIGDQLKAQEGVPLPDPRHIPVEIIDDPDRTDVYRIVFHSFRGGAINHPFALALSRHLEDSIGARVETRVETLADDNAVLLSLPRLAGEEPEKLISQSILAISGANGQTLFRRQLEASGLFGAEFREAAERSIVLVKTSFGKRTPLWFTRQRSRRLFDAVSGFNDFPLTAEAWRSCLKDRFDLPGFAALIKDIVSGTVTLSFFRTRLPTPFSREQIWKDTGAHMYEYDERPDLRTAGAAGRVTLADQIIKEALEKAGARPPLPAALQADFSARLRREVPGWAPSSALSLGEWVRERIAIPLDEWECLLAAIPEALREELRTDTTLDGRIARIKREGAETAAMVHRDIAESWEADAVRLLGPWLRFQGPVTPARIGAVFGTDPAETESAILALCESGELVRDVRVSKTKTSFVCDRENLEILLRLSRKKSRPQIAERPVSVLIPFLVRRQGILIRDRDGNDRHGVFIPEPAMPWGKLLGFAAHVPLWERDIFPCRTADYSPEKLDREIAMGYLFWYGAGNERAAFSYASTTDLVLPERNGEEDLPELFLAHRAFFERERDFWEIKEKLGLDTRSCAELIWRLAWQGLVSSDTWESVRRFIEHGAVPKSILEQMGSLSNMCGRDRKFGRRVPRAIRERRREGPPVPGRWFSLETDGGFGGPAGMDPRGMDPLDEENLNRQRIRLLLERWGVLARPLLERETSCFSWSKLLPAMRRMELAGELYSGRFFAGLNSLQFAAPGIEWELAAAEDERGIYRMNACDPASPAGLELEGLPYPLPSRLPGNRLCFRGASPAYVSTRNGREIKFFFPPEDPDAESITGLLVPPRKTAAASRKTVIEKINGVSAARSPYGEILKTLGFVPDRDKLILW